MSTPNIFSYATKELSQDAFICWLVACAAEATSPLHECGLAFVRTLFRAGASDESAGIPVMDPNGNPIAPYNGSCEVSDVGNPCTQYNRIDVYFQARVDGQIVSFIIEDKIDGQPSKGQLKGYLDAVIQDPEEKDLIKPVYFKTGYVFSDEREAVEQNNYSVFEAEDMKNFLNCHQEVVRQNQILCHYAKYLNDKKRTRVEAFANWDLNQDYVQWEFMEKLRDVLRGAAGEWRFSVPRALPNFQHAWRNILIRGKNRDGTPFTQYWFTDHLFWRLDAWRPLRLMYLDNAGQNYNGIQETYRDYFNEALDQEGLPAGNARIVRRGRERTIGSINTENLQEMTVRKFLHRVKRVHIRFLESIS